MSTRSLVIGIILILAAGGVASLLVDTGREPASSGAASVKQREGTLAGASGDAGTTADSALGFVSAEVMLDVGDIAPDFSLERLDGGTFTLSEDGRSSVVFVNFWATWCEPCREEAADLQQLYDELRGDGLVVVGISLDRDGRALVQEFRETFPVEYPLLLDGLDVAEEYGAHYTVPTSFVVGRDGRIVERYIGAINRDDVVGRLRAAVAA